MKTYTIILAGGHGARMNSSVNKVLMNVCGKSVIQRSIEAFLGLTDEMVIVYNPDDREKIISEAGKAKSDFSISFVAGGNSRQASVRNGLLSVQCEDHDIILIHDAARCLVEKDTITGVIRSVPDCGAVIPAVQVSSTYKICSPEQYIINTPDRSMLYEAQTPQGFFSELIKEVYNRAETDHAEATDDASLMEKYGYSVRVVSGSKNNIKLTTPEDLLSAELILKGAVHSMRIGMGYDVHRLVVGRKLVLCGVEIPWSLGLLGHSDADVALHALMDAMLGACASGDIGKHFPDTDPEYKGISSLILLDKVNRIVESKHFKVNNLDLTIVAQKPKLLPYIPQMISNIASVLGISEERINIKATTTEQLGFEGRQEGISAYAVCSVAEA